MKQFRTMLISAFILLFALSFVLSGCGSGQPTDGSSPQEDGGLASYHLKLYYPGSPQADQKLVDEALNRILKDKINATVELIPIDWGQWENKVNLMIASREQFDILFTAQWNGHAVNVGKGAFLPLNDDNLDKYGNLLSKHGSGILESLDPTFLTGARINGFNYGVPTNKEMAASGGVVYRADIAQELGLDMSKVKTIEDLEPILQTVKEKRPDMIPLFLRDGDNFNTHYFAQYDFLGDSTIPGVVLKDQDSTKIVHKYDLDRYINTVQITRDYMVKGYINSDAATTTLSSQNAMKAGNVFMITQSLKPGKDAELANATGLPGKLKQIEMTTRTVSTGDTAGSMLGISSTSKDPERAMMFINLLHTDKTINNLVNFGLEGVHYEKAGDNIIKPAAQTNRYNPGAAWMFGNQFLNYIWDTEDSNKWDQFREFNNNVRTSPGLGFTFNAENVKTEIAAAVNVGKEYDAIIDTGSVDPGATLPKYKEKMNAAGADQILAEKQRQFDEFLATKK